MQTEKFSFIENNDGSVHISCVSHNVGTSGGGSYEANYYLNKEGADRLEALLGKTYSGTLENMIELEFGVNLNRRGFSDYCKENAVPCEVFTWIGD